MGRRSPFSGLLGRWRSREASRRRRAERLAEAGPRPPPRRALAAAAAAQPLLSSHSQAATLEARVAMAAVPELLQQQEEDRSKVRPWPPSAPGPGGSGGHPDPTLLALVPGRGSRGRGRRRGSARSAWKVAKTSRGRPRGAREIRFAANDGARNRAPAPPKYWGNSIESGIGSVSLATSKALSAPLREGVLSFLAGAQIVELNFLSLLRFAC